MPTFGNCTYSNTNIQRLFITDWTTEVIPYFDARRAITDLNWLTGSWLEINIDTVNVSFNQTANPPNQNGITYTEILSILIPHSDATKWLDLLTVLTGTYMVVFQDGNGEWFIIGWMFGSRVRRYSVEGNQYTLNFVNDGTVSLLTSIRESYVTANIL